MCLADFVLKKPVWIWAENDKNNIRALFTNSTTLCVLFFTVDLVSSAIYIGFDEGWPLWRVPKTPRKEEGQIIRPILTLWLVWELILLTMFSMGFSRGDFSFRRFSFGVSSDIQP